MVLKISRGGEDLGHKSSILRSVGVRYNISDDSILYAYALPLDDRSFKLRIMVVIRDSSPSIIRSVSGVTNNHGT